MIWQTKNWGKMLLASKQAESVFDIGGIQVEKRCVGLGLFGLFVIGLDYETPGIKGNMQELEDHLIALCKREKALFIQLEFMTYSGELKKKFFDLDTFDFGYYKKFITQYSAFIKLGQTTEEILAGMKPKGRYNIRLAEKKGVTCEIVENNSKNIQVFYNLLKETTSRDNFSGNSLEYYTSFMKMLTSSELIFASKDGVVIAGGIFTFNKMASIYYYGASTSKKEYRNLMAPYLVQWKAIEHAKDSGSEVYDFLGVATPGNDNHPLKGVTDFKKKFTSNIKKVSEAYIYVNNPFQYRLLLLVRFCKNILIQAKSKIMNIIKK